MPASADKGKTGANKLKLAEEEVRSWMNLEAEGAADDRYCKLWLHGIGASLAGWQEAGAPAGEVAAIADRVYAAHSDRLSGSGSVDGWSAWARLVFADARERALAVAAARAAKEIEDEDERSRRLAVLKEKLKRRRDGENTGAGPAAATDAPPPLATEPTQPPKKRKRTVLQGDARPALAKTGGEKGTRERDPKSVGDAAKCDYCAKKVKPVACVLQSGARSCDKCTKQRKGCLKGIVPYAQWLAANVQAQGGQELQSVTASATRSREAHRDVAKGGAALLANVGASGSKEVAGGAGAIGVADTSKQGVHLLPTAAAPRRDFDFSREFKKTLEKTSLSSASSSTRRLREFGDATSGLDPDNLANTGLSKKARCQIRALRAERAFTLARIDVLTQVAEHLEERERELMGKEWGAEDFEESDEALSDCDEDEDTE